ncbi:hypothetical protein, partial [Clostridium perfringens]
MLKFSFVLQILATLATYLYVAKDISLSLIFIIISIFIQITCIIKFYYKKKIIVKKNKIFIYIIYGVLFNSIFLLSY